MDKMTEWEINDLIENLPYLDRNLWETCRLNSYFLVKMNTNKNVNIQDIIAFKWDTNVKRDIEISNEDIKRLKEKAKHIKI